MVKKGNATIALVILMVLALAIGYVGHDALYYTSNHVVVDGQDCHIEQINRGGRDLFGPQTPGDEVLVIAHCAK